VTQLKLLTGKPFNYNSMKTRYGIIGVAALCLLMACQPREKTITMHITPIRASSLYNPDEVYRYMQTYKDSNKALAEQYYEKGRQMYFKNPEEATYYFKRSLSLHPDHAHYIELSELLNLQKNYAEMNELYRMLMFRFANSDSKTPVYIFGKPSETEVENYVVTNILVYNTVWNNLGEQLALTDSLGYKMNDIKESIMSDGRIKLSKPTAENRNVLWGFLTQDEKMEYYKDESLPDYYAKHLNDTATTFDINENDVRQFVYRYGDMEGHDYSDNIFDAYDDFVADTVKNYSDHNFERHYKLNDSLEVLIYAVDTSATACPKDMRCIYHVLEVYYEGYYRIPTHIIATKVVAVQSGEQLATVKFNHNKFTITYFKRTWEKPFNKDDFDNHLKKIEQTGEESFMITPRGKIKKVSNPAGDKATS
jgi:hypothetical protein